MRILFCLVLIFVVGCSYESTPGVNTDTVDTSQLEANVEVDLPASVPSESAADSELEDDPSATEAALVLEPPANGPGAIDEDAPEEFTTTDSGLKYRILRASDQEKPTPKDQVTVHYRGWLPSESNPSEGEEFDSSYRRGEPITFGLGQVIPGWTEGMQLIGKGGMVELEVPSELGYGEHGTPGGPIPPSATLRFIVELIDFQGPAKPGPVDPNAPTEFTTTESGLKFRMLREGTGESPIAANDVTVHYRGWLPEDEDPSEGFEFDSSYERGTPASFPLRGVIGGWTEGVQLMKEGGMIELECPPDLAYGDETVGDIPANATLRFIIELIRVR